MDGLQTMLERLGGIQKLKARELKKVQWYVFRSTWITEKFLTIENTRSDFCYSNIWNSPLRFPLYSHNIPRPVEKSQVAGNILMDPEQVFGIDSPINPIILSLRRITSKVNTGYDLYLDDLRLSPELYEIEYQLHLLKADTTSSVMMPEAKLVGIGMHIYLYVMIRHIPPESQLIIAFLQRLKTAVGSHDASLWETEADNGAWLLWLLFVGFGVTTTFADEEWFLNRLLGQYEYFLAMGAKYPLDGFLKKVLWHDIWCEKQYDRLAHHLPIISLHDSI